MSIRDELLKASKTYTPERRNWTKAEDAILDEFFGKVPMGLLAKKLNRSVASIRWRYAAKKRGEL